MVEASARRLRFRPQQQPKIRTNLTRVLLKSLVPIIAAAVVAMPLTSQPDKASAQSIQTSEPQCSARETAKTSQASNFKEAPAQAELTNTGMLIKVTMSKDRLS